MNFHRIAGNMHVHTVYSDGASPHREIAAAAARAGLDFIVATDHNVWVDGVEGYYDGVLTLVGEEVHDPTRQPWANHLLVYGAEAELAPYAQDPQQIIEAARQQDGLCFLAHPFARTCGLDPKASPVPWVNWDVEGYTGLEIWNTMSDFKGALWSRLAAAFYLLAPGAALRGPHPATRRKWDELLAAGRRVTAIAGADAHARRYKIGIVRKVGFPYETLFRWVNTHLLVERPLSGDLATDKRLVYDALRAGRTWVGYDRLASTHSFLFQARSGTNVATIGDELARTAATVFEVTTPKRGSIRLIRNGQVVAHGYGSQLSFTTTEPGAYRVEVYRSLWGEPRGWIFSSPIYVH